MTRGVIATCNYEARALGVRSAMPTARALKLCPQLTLLPPRMERYRQVSRQIMAIYKTYAERVEPLSLDEAYLDVSDSKQHKGSATLIAEDIRRRVAQEVGVTVSAGVAKNKFLAKVASDWNKPNGMYVILPDKIDEFVQTLPVGRIWGVGKVTQQKLENLGWRTCGELQAASLATLTEHFGRLGQALYDRCRGEDAREVEPLRQRKSLSVEETYPADLPGVDACLREVPELFQQLQRRILKTGLEHAIHKCVVKIKFSDFTLTTHETVCGQPDMQVFCHLLEAGLARKNLPVRLLGLGVRFAETPTNTSLQLSLF